MAISGIDYLYEYKWVDFTIAPEIIAKYELPAPIYN